VGDETVGEDGHGILLPWSPRGGERLGEFVHADGVEHPEYVRQIFGHPDLEGNLGEALAGNRQFRPEELCAIVCPSACRGIGFIGRSRRDDIGNIDRNRLVEGIPDLDGIGQDLIRIGQSVLRHAIVLIIGHLLCRDDLAPVLSRLPDLDGHRVLGKPFVFLRHFGIFSAHVGNGPTAELGGCRKIGWLVVRLVVYPGGVFPVGPCFGLVVVLGLFPSVADRTIGIAQGISSGRGCKRFYICVRVANGLVACRAGHLDRAGIEVVDLDGNVRARCLAGIPTIDRQGREAVKFVLVPNRIWSRRGQMLRVEDYLRLGEVLRIAHDGVRASVRVPDSPGIRNHAVGVAATGGGRPGERGCGLVRKVDVLVSAHGSGVKRDVLFVGHRQPFRALASAGNLRGMVRLAVRQLMVRAKWRAARWRIVPFVGRVVILVRVCQGPAGCIVAVAQRGRSDGRGHDVHLDGDGIGRAPAVFVVVGNGHAAERGGLRQRTGLVGQCGCSADNGPGRAVVRAFFPFVADAARAAAFQTGGDRLWCPALADRIVVVLYAAAIDLAHRDGDRIGGFGADRAAAHVRECHPAKPGIGRHRSRRRITLAVCVRDWCPFAAVLGPGFPSVGHRAGGGRQASGRDRHWRSVLAPTPSP